MSPRALRTLREDLGLDRAVLAQFLGVAERTVRRWEGNERHAPHGLQFVTFTAMHAAVCAGGPEAVSKIIEESSVTDHGRALKSLFNLAYKE